MVLAGTAGQALASTTFGYVRTNPSKGLVDEALIAWLELKTAEIIYFLFTYLGGGVENVHISKMARRTQMLLAQQLNIFSKSFC